MKYWSKALLSIYKYLESMVDSIDKTISKSTKNNTSCISDRQSAYFQASRIIELIDRKRKMINLKVAFEESLVRLNSKERRILGLAYIDGVKSEVIAELMGISIRTFFRLKSLALTHLSQELQLCGFDKDYFDTEYGQEKWFVSVHDELVIKSTNSDDYLNRALVKRIMAEIPKVYVSNSYTIY